MHAKNHAHAQRPDHGGADGVEPRERRLLRWVARGHSAAEIARRLQRDEKQVAARLAELLARLGVDSAKAALEKLGLPLQAPDDDDDDEAAPPTGGGNSSGDTSTTPF